MGRPRTLPDTPRAVKQRERAKQQRVDNPEQANANRRAWRARNLDAARKYERDRRAAFKRTYPEIATYRNRVSALKPYGLTPEQWDAMFKAQDGRCAICGTTESFGRWHTDHDEQAGRTAVRGILCVKCNIGIGQFDHDTNKLAHAIAYLKRGTTCRT